MKKFLLILIAISLTLFALWSIFREPMASQYPSISSFKHSGCQQPIVQSLEETVEEAAKGRLGLISSTQDWDNLLLEIGLCMPCGAEGYNSFLYAFEDDTIKIVLETVGVIPDLYREQAASCNCYYTFSYEIRNLESDKLSKILFNNMPLDSLAKNTSCVSEELMEIELDIE